MQFESRGKPKQNISLLAAINSVVFVTVLATLGIASLVLDKPTYSESERRDLSQKPAFSTENYLSGEYNRGLDLFYSDTFPQREGFVRLAANIKDLRGIRMDDIRIHGTAPVPGTDEPSSQPEPDSEVSAPDASSSVPEISAPESSSDGGDVPIDNYNSIVVYKNMALPLYGGNNSVGRYYAEMVNYYKESLGSDFKVYSMVVPTSVEFYLPDNYKHMSNSQWDSIQNIYDNLRSDVIGVDAYSAIAAHTDEYIYFRTDHHWTGLGAYYAYTAFAEAAGFTPYAYEDYTKNTLDDFIGSLYSQTQDPKLLETPDSVEYCEIPIDYTAYRYGRENQYFPVKTSLLAAYAKGVNSYSVYLHGDHPMMLINTTNKNGRKLVIVKESYGNAVATYMIPHYETVIIIDERYFGRNLAQVMTEYGMNEILFVNNAFSANTQFHVDNSWRLLNQPNIVYPPPEEESSEEEESSGEEHSGGDGGDDGNRIIVVE